MKECVTHHWACDCREAKISQLARELAEAHATINGWRMKIDGCVTQHCACRFDENDKPLRECNEHKDLRKDAERYRYLRNSEWDNAYDNIIAHQGEDDFEALIDAATAKAAEPGS